MLHERTNPNCPFLYINVFVNADEYETSNLPSVPAHRPRTVDLLQHPLQAKLGLCLVDLLGGLRFLDFVRLGHYRFL